MDCRPAHEKPAWTADMTELIWAVSLQSSCNAVSHAATSLTGGALRYRQGSLAPCQ